MTRLLVIAILIAVACRWALGRWPWEMMSTRPSRNRALVRARRMLGVRPAASREDIRAAHRRMAGQLHPDRGGSDARLAEINAARDLLLDELSNESPETRK